MDKQTIGEEMWGILPTVVCSHSMLLIRWWMSCNLYVADSRKAEQMLSTIYSDKIQYYM